MCIIVDTNAGADLATPSEDGAPVLRWLLTGGGALIIGGKLKRELVKSGKMRATLVTLNQAGRLHNLNDSTVEAVEKKIEAQKMCCSDDPHVIAVAVLSGCRLIFTKDKNLHKDAKNTGILNPAASIYQSKSHQHLLTTCVCV